MSEEIKDIILKMYVCWYVVYNVQDYYKWIYNCMKFIWWWLLLKLVQSSNHPLILFFFLKLKVFNQARYQIKRSENPVRFHYIPVDKILFLDQTLPATYM